MKTSQQSNLSQSVGWAFVLVVMSLGVILLMSLSSGIL